VLIGNVVSCNANECSSTNTTLAVSLLCSGSAQRAVDEWREEEEEEEGEEGGR